VSHGTVHFLPNELLLLQNNDFMAAKRRRTDAKPALGDENVSAADNVLLSTSTPASVPSSSAALAAASAVSSGVGSAAVPSSTSSVASSVSSGARVAREAKDIDEDVDEVPEDDRQAIFKADPITKVRIIEGMMRDIRAQLTVAQRHLALEEAKAAYDAIGNMADTACMLEDVVGTLPGVEVPQ